jgi:hypothetical protein
MKRRRGWLVLLALVVAGLFGGCANDGSMSQGAPPYHGGGGY